MIELRTDLFDNVPMVKFYDNEDNYLGETNNEIIFNDFRCQIKSAQATGYYMVYEGKKIRIDRNGTPEEWVDPFDLNVGYLLQLI